MRDIIKVSISGIAFVLDDQAFRVMDGYIKKLEEGYRGNPDGKEIIADIEARIAEIILAKQSSETVVGDELVRTIIDQLGFPDDLRRDGDDYIAGPETVLQKFPRRLYRNPEGARLGGVCSGLATFFDIDAVWIRVGVFLPLIIMVLTASFLSGPIYSFFGTLFGALVLSYIILWFAIPLARTPRQKLEMRGEKITVSSIHNSLKDDFTQISGDGKRGQRWASLLTELAYLLGRILLFCVKAVALLVGLGLALGAIGLIVCFCTLLFGSHTGVMLGFMSQVEMIGVSNSAYLALLALVALIPVVLITYLLLRLVFNLPAHRTALSVIAALWLMLTIYVGYVSVENYSNISSAIDVLKNEIRNDFGDYDDFDDCDEAPDLQSISSTVVTEGIIEGDSTRTDSVVVKIEENKVRN